MIDLLSVLLGYLLGTFLTGALCVFLLGWTSGNLEDLKWAAAQERTRENPDHR